MKLVDILARELKVWPEGYDDIGQAESGRLHVVTGWHFKKGWTEEYFAQAEDWTSAVITRAEWQAAVDALNAPKVVEWDGLGRPPEGTVCGLWYKGCDQGECTVLFMGAEVGVFKSHAFDHEQHGDLVHYSFYKVEGSTEEKDAQERKKAIAEMTAIAGGQYSPRDSIVQRLFDAGYRKEPKQCGS